MIQLKDVSKSVSFNSEQHTYTRCSDGKALHGVTEMLRTLKISPDYSGIPEEILQAAAERGKSIHLDCDVVDALDSPCGREEADAYLSLRKARGLTPVISEYFVTDGEDIASFVDLVLTTDELMKENKVILADIKCTSTLHEKPLSWQLSIYKRLFEAQNPNVKVAGLLGVWLPKKMYGEPDIVDVEEQDETSVVEAMECFKCGLAFSSEEDNATSVDIATEMMLDRLAGITQQVKELKDEEKELREKLSAFMADNNLKKYNGNGYSVTYVPEKKRVSFDSAALKKSNPEVYKQYTKETTTAASLLVSIKNK